MTVTPTAAPPRKSREITVSFLGALLFNAGFIDDRQKAEVDNVDRQFRTQARSAKSRAEDESSPFKALMAMNLTDASGSSPRIDNFRLPPPIPQEAHPHLYKNTPPQTSPQTIATK